MNVIVDTLAHSVQECPTPIGFDTHQGRIGGESNCRAIRCMTRRTCSRMEHVRREGSSGDFRH